MEFLSKNGAQVRINPADFEDAMDLQSAIFTEAAKAEFKIDGLSVDSEFDLSGLIKAGMSVAASKEVREILFKCLVRCTYKGQKITKQTFEDMDARKDYYEIVLACLKENLTPFFEGLLSKLKPLSGLMKQTESQT